MIERKIGEVFKCMTGETVMCIKDTRGMCKGCIHAKDKNCRQDKAIGLCSMSMRKDKTSVIFKKVNRRDMKQFERKIGEVFKCMTGQLVMCVKSSEMSCRGCVYCGNGICNHDNSIGNCSPRKRSDGNSVIFQVVNTSPSLAKDINTLERIAEDYPGKTIENIIEQLRSRLNETKSHI